MDLREWQKLHRWTTTAMAKEIGITYGTLSGIGLKKYKASLALKKAIVAFTMKEVSLADLEIKRE